MSSALYTRIRDHEATTALTAADVRKRVLDAATRIATDPAFAHTRDLVVVQQGEEVVAHRFGGGSVDEPADTYSVTKSVVSTLAGIALDRGEFGSLDDELSSYLGDAPDGLTLRHLLTMTVGAETEGPWEIDEVMARPSGWVDWILAAPRRHEPGLEFAYDNGAAHVLGAALAAATGAPLSAFAHEWLFAPLGISEYEWPRDPDGRDYGFGHLRLRPRELATIGLLYLGGGEYRGRRVVSQDYVDGATRQQSEGGPPEGAAYGFFWWVAGEPFPHFFAGGYAGQSVTVIPQLELVAVTTGDEARLRRGWRNARHAILDALT